MMSLHRVILLLPLLFLTACNNVLVEKKEYIMVPPATPQARMCAQHCAATKDHCHISCEALYHNCEVKAKAAAEQTYMQYMQTRLAYGLVMDKQMTDFTPDTSACPSVQRCVNGCDINQRNCHTSCGGEIRMNDRCISNCDVTPPKSTLRDVADWFSDKPEE